MKSFILFFILFLGLACSADSEELMECNKFSSQADSIVFKKVQTIEQLGSKQIEAPYIEDEKPLFVLIDTLNFESQVEDIVQGNLFVTVTIPNEEIAGYIVYSYSFDGEELWSIDFDSTEFINLTGNELSSLTLIRFPIPSEDTYNTGLRDCRNIFVNSEGEISFEFKRPCTSYTLTNSDRYLLQGVEHQHENSFAVIDLKEIKSVFTDDYVVGNVFDYSKFAVFKKTTEESKIEIHEFVDDSIQLNSEMNFEYAPLFDSTLSVIIENMEFKNGILQLNGRTRTNPPRSNQITYSLNGRNRTLKNQTRSEIVNYFTLFYNIENDRLGIFESKQHINEAKSISDSTAIILLSPVQELGQKHNHLLNVVHYNFINNEVLFKNENIVQDRANRHWFVPNFRGKNKILMNYYGSITDDPLPCKTNIKLINLTNLDVFCPPLFENYELMFRPRLFQNSGDPKQFILHNSLGDRLIFAQKNDEF